MRAIPDSFNTLADQRVELSTGQREELHETMTPLWNFLKNFYRRALHGALGGPP